MTSAKEIYLSSQQGSAELIRSVMGGGTLSNNDHLRTLGEEIHDGKKDWEAAYGTKLKGLFHDLKVTNMCLILRAKSIGAWMSVHGTTVSCTLLSATEFRDILCACYKVLQLNIQSHCDGCGTVFGVTHGIICSTGGLVIARHKKIHGKLL